MYVLGVLKVYSNITTPFHRCSLYSSENKSWYQAQNNYGSDIAIKRHGCLAANTCWIRTPARPDVYGLILVVLDMIMTADALNSLFHEEEYQPSVPFHG